ncbi:MAG: 30S ribosome-binding factor RbfA [Chloroflexota bacterium]
MSIRAEKIASVIKRALSAPISDIAREHISGLVTVTSVRMSNDLQHAKVYVSLYGKSVSPGRLLQLLDNNKHEFKQIISRELRLRFTPDLKFFLDDALDQMEHIQKLLDSVRREDKENESE